MRLAAAFCVAGTLLLAGCGGSEEYAGLTREEAEAQIAEAVELSEARGDVAELVRGEIAGGGEEAMSRAGSSDVASVGVTGEPTITKGSRPGTLGEVGPAWVATYGLRGLGSSLALCAYGWESEVELTVSTTC